jgi:hypothetical protein
MLHSSVWQEPHDVRVAWVTMLLLTNYHGEVKAAIPALAMHNAVSVSRMEEIIKIFLSPDPYSKSKDYDGRRLMEIDGGWQVINYPKYRDGLKQPDRTAKVRQQRKRERDKEDCHGASVTERDSHGASRLVTASHAYSDSDSDSDSKIKENPKKDSCSEPESKPSDSKPADPVVAEFPISGEPNIWYLKKSKMQEWAKVYGEQCDVRSELIKAKQWLIDNPVRRKTTRGMTRFLNTWLQNAINSNRAALPPGVTRPETPEDVQRRLGLRT